MGLKQRGGDGREGLHCSHIDPQVLSRIHSVSIQATLAFAELGSRASDSVLEQMT